MDAGSYQYKSRALLMPNLHFLVMIVSSGSSSFANAIMNFSPSLTGVMLQSFEPFN